MKVTLRYLRKMCPGWDIVAERSLYGIGWTYAGTRHGARVEIYPTAVMVDEDRFETVWRVDDGKCSETLSVWMFLGDGGAA